MNEKNPHLLVILQNLKNIYTSITEMLFSNLNLKIQFYIS